jgi:hypothetical protein
MCDFHSILGVAIGDDYEIRHDADNSHSNMAGRIENKPNRRPVIFEGECSAEKLLRCSDIEAIKSSIIRNFGECPELLVRKMVSHYQKVKEALTDGSHLAPDGYFGDTKKYADVWNAAINRNVPVTLPAIFGGDLFINSSAKLDAPALAEVGGYLYINSSAKLDAPALAEVGGDLSINSSAKLDAPALAEVGGYLFINSSAKLDAPALAEVGEIGRAHV